MDMKYTFAVAGGTTSIPNDCGLVSVVDGCTYACPSVDSILLMNAGNLKVTPLRKANVPPPMSLYEVSHNRSIVDSASNSDGSHIAILDQRQLSILQYKTESSEYSTISHRDIPLGSRGIDLPRQVAFLGDSDIFILIRSQDTHQDTIFTATLEGETLSMSMPLKFPFAIVCLASALDHSAIFIEGASGTISELRHGQCKLNGIDTITGAVLSKLTFLVSPVAEWLPWPRPCPRFEVWQNSTRVRMHSKLDFFP